MWIQSDDCLEHYAQVQWLNQRYSQRWIGRGGPTLGAHVQTNDLPYKSLHANEKLVQTIYKHVNEKFDV